MTTAEVQTQGEAAHAHPPKLDVTILIPAFNEENAIEAEVDHIHRVMRETSYAYEIIVVDDCSKDRTFELASKKECRVLRQPRNMGYGAALKRGFRESHTDLVVITDADGTYPAEDIPRLLAEASTFDMVVGARTGENVHIPLVRRPAKWFLRVLASYLAEFPIPDLNSGLRAIRKHHVKRFAHILPSGFSFTTTITLSLLCNELTVGYVPIDYRKRIGSSKIRPSDAYRFLLLILRVMVLFNPLRVFLPIGAVVGILGLGKFSYDLTKANLSDGAVMGVLGAILIWSVGLLADQNAKLGVDRGEQWPE
ncbi:MAG: glycosyltransferase family 2 protein [Myxococcales bacterium]|nr:glycosyltransferase family 2 protein [Myxococcales bacterium]